MAECMWRRVLLLEPGRVFCGREILVVRRVSEGRQKRFDRFLRAAKHRQHSGVEGSLPSRAGEGCDTEFPRFLNKFEDHRAEANAVKGVAPPQRLHNVLSRQLERLAGPTS